MCTLRPSAGSVQKWGVGARQFVTYQRVVRVEGPISKRSANLIDIHLGQTIRAFRLEKGLTITELAHRVGVSRSQIESYENGGNRVPASRLNRISDVLGVPLAFLIDGSGAARSLETDNVQPASPLTSAGLRLLQAFNEIPNKRMRRAILDFFEKVARV